jgi:hypothetical protein
MPDFISRVNYQGVVTAIQQLYEYSRSENCGVAGPKCQIASAAVSVPVMGA